MTRASRLLATVGLLAAFSAVPARAVPVSVLEGEIAYAAVVDGDLVEAVAGGSVFDGEGEGFEITMGGLFDLDPLGANPGLVFLNIFEPVSSTLVLSSFTLLDSVVGPGSVATLVFLIEDGERLGRVAPEVRLVLSGLTGGAPDGAGTMQVTVFLAAIPLPTAAPMLMAAIAGLALAARRFRGAIPSPPPR